MLQDSLPFFDWPEQMQKEVSGDKDAGSSHGDHVKKKKTRHSGPSLATSGSLGCVLA